MVLPEIHKQRRDREAAHIIILVRSCLRLKTALFLEGVLPSQTADAQAKYGAPIIPIEHKELHMLNGKLWFLLAVLEFNMLKGMEGKDFEKTEIMCEMEYLAPFIGAGSIGYAPDRKSVV